jgi:large subunit ribosomal protein L6
MSRVAKAPVDLASGVEVTIAGQEVTVKGSKGTLNRTFNDAVEIAQEENQLKTLPREGFVDGWAQAGTARAILNAMVQGVSQGFEKKLQLNGVGYRAQAQGAKLNLTLGFSHPVVYEMPEGITVETPSQTEIVVKGADKQKVGQVAANIRA